MNFYKVFAILAVLLTLCTYDVEGGLTLLLLMKLVALKGALFIGAPLAFGSFLLGQGIGFLGGSLIGTHVIKGATEKLMKKQEALKSKAMMAANIIVALKSTTAAPTTTTTAKPMHMYGWGWIPVSSTTTEAPSTPESPGWGWSPDVTTMTPSLTSTTEPPTSWAYSSYNKNYGNENDYVWLSPPNYGWPAQPTYYGWSSTEPSTSSTTESTTTTAKPSTTAAPTPTSTKSPLWASLQAFAGWSPTSKPPETSSPTAAKGLMPALKSLVEGPIKKLGALPMKITTWAKLPTVRAPAPHPVGLDPYPHHQYHDDFEHDHHHYKDFEPDHHHHHKGFEHDHHHHHEDFEHDHHHLHHHPASHTHPHHHHDGHTTVVIHAHKKRTGRPSLVSLIRKKLGKHHGKNRKPAVVIHEIHHPKPSHLHHTSHPHYVHHSDLHHQHHSSPHSHHPSHDDYHDLSHHNYHDEEHQHHGNDFVEDPSGHGHDDHSYDEGWGYDGEGRHYGHGHFPSDYYDTESHGWPATAGSKPSNDSSSAPPPSMTPDMSSTPSGEDFSSSTANGFPSMDTEFVSSSSSPPYKAQNSPSEGYRYSPPNKSPPPAGYRRRRLRAGGRLRQRGQMTPSMNTQFGRRSGDSTQEINNFVSPSPPNMIERYLEKKLNEEIQTQKSESKKREALELMSMLRDAYVQELANSVHPLGNGPTTELPPFVPIPAEDSVPNSTTMKASPSVTVTRVQPPPKTYFWRNPFATYQNTRYVPIIKTSFVLRPKKQQKVEHPEFQLTESEAQAVAAFKDDVKKFFLLVSLLDQDQCLQKLICDIHTKAQTSKLSSYEKNIVTTFTVMTTVIPDSEEDSTSPYRKAAKIGAASRMTGKTCTTSFSSCTYSTEQIIKMGNQVLGQKDLISKS